MNAQAIAARLIDMGVATLHESMGRRGLMVGIKLLVGPSFAGPAATAWIPGGDNLGVHAVVRTAPRGSIVCVASHGNGTFGVVGELLLMAARERGIRGLVLEDGIRDFELLEAPPSIAARGISARGTTKQRILGLGRSIPIAGTLVRPGDWIVGDADGVCVVPTEVIAETVESARNRVAKETAIAAEIRAGRPLAEILGLTDRLDQMTDA